MRNMIVTAALFALAFLPARAADAPAAHPDYAVIVMTADVNRPADVAWTRIDSDFCSIQKYLDIMSCTITAGSGDLGTTRLINGRIVEVLVAKTAHSYTYSQPATTIFYHATLAVEPVDAGHSKIVYTMIYDQAPLTTPEAQAANRAMRTTRFQAAVDKMKVAAEAP